MPKNKFTINRDMFEGQEFNAIMASGGGRRLFVTYCDGGHLFKVENLRNDGEIVVKTASLGEAIRAFNKL